MTERHHREVFVIDTFLHPTKELALLVRSRGGSIRGVSAWSTRPRGYTRSDSVGEHRLEESSKPIVARNLPKGDG